MKTKELLDLIQIREYVFMSINTLNSLSKDSIHTMAKLLPKVDRKIASILEGSEFTNYIESAINKD